MEYDEPFSIEQENADKQFIDCCIGVAAWIGLGILAIISVL